MLDTTPQGDEAAPDDGRRAASAQERRPADEERHATDEEPRGCLFALSQPPLMIFLTVIGMLILLASLHDLLLL
ncbi:hypothetical protein JQK87_12765 [Streptomyces sp. G44]|uniref:hypothetical protein n=1 Tax=Streptomyces sp. G44 TaxID=2807632 RepID=UPI00196073D8|nr:hypothetical protein [Streptomyces sp. G44]MBM7169274.1 hypothetical protein [Streptomyces sp. G44]